ncbi:MAG: hypothetical protein AB1603_00725 [Chloroflexota bacterium]
MEKRTGGQWAQEGVYVSLRSGEVVNVADKGGILPGQSTVSYVKVPMLVVAALGPLVGLAYWIFLPFIGIATIAWFAAHQIAQGARALGHRAMQLTTAEWQPGMSFFARRRRTRQETKSKRT